MIVRASAEGVVLDDAQNLKALSLVLEGDGARARAAGIGDWTDEAHLAVPAPELVRLAGELGRDPMWRRDFDAMIDYARSKGWVDDAGRVRMHVA
ncbi:hypothetical protein [Kineosporia succinea]|uniref:Uncharacterized protein n=1 Tax=Kineosporia succinea TaxID=84632 RepID=A0ABT9PEU5_9ACTN|nr:hypothetical protein [Kineosporia succinea]MDP9831223.1 hypothetical protein [Kineosporia succinea]